MEDYYGLGRRNRGKESENEDFQEEEVWAAIKERERETSSSKVMMRRRKSSASSCGEPSRAEQSSVPVSIPDWSKIYNSMKRDHKEKEEEEDDDENGVVPPHEYIARRLARSQIASFSMCEGVGRTLKGRDLSKLRNAILTKTGFLEG